MANLVASIPKDLKDYTRYNHIYNENLELWTPHNSPSDALLASLGFVYEPTSPIIDTISNVVNRPKFFSGRPTLKKAGDIYASVADYRRENAVRLPCREFTHD